MSQSALKPPASYSGFAVAHALYLGNLCDYVLLATYERETAPLSDDSLRKIEELANWFSGMSLLLANPLNLSESLPHVSKLEIVKYLDAQGYSLDYTLSPIAPEVATLTSRADTRGTLSKKMSQLLRDLASNEIEESFVRSLQEALSNLSTKLLPAGRTALS